MWKYKRESKGQTLRLRSGQSTVEYIVLATAVIAVVIFFVTNQNTGLRGHLTNMVDTAADRIDSKAQTLQNTYHSPSRSAPGPIITVDPNHRAAIQPN